MRDASTERWGGDLEGLQRSLPQQRTFHPQAVDATARNGQPLVLRMAESSAIVDARPLPASKGEARTDEILSIAFAGPVTASARLRGSVRPRHFIDLPTLVHGDVRWQAIAKVFHWNEPPCDACGWSCVAFRDPAGRAGLPRMRRVPGAGAGGSPDRCSRTLPRP